MKTPDDYAEAAYDLVSIRGKDTWHMPEVRALFAEAMADARRAALEEAAKVAEAPQGHYDIGGKRLPWWSGETIAKSIRALLETAAAGT